ncbi:hypothetical protein BOX15_Mlig025502g4, partial [Macrostomum lignano]
SAKSINLLKLSPATRESNSSSCHMLTSKLGNGPDMPEVDAASATAADEVSNFLNRLTQSGLDGSSSQTGNGNRKRKLAPSSSDGQPSEAAICASVDKIAKLNLASLAKQLDEVCKAAEEFNNNASNEDAGNGDSSLDDLADCLLSETQVALTRCLPASSDTASAVVVANASASSKPADKASEVNGTDAEISPTTAVSQLQSFIDDRFTAACNLEAQVSSGSDDDSIDLPASVDSLLSTCLAKSPSLVSEVRRLGRGLAQSAGSGRAAIASDSGDRSQAELALADFKQNLAVILRDNTQSTADCSAESQSQPSQQSRHFPPRRRLRRLPVDAASRLTRRANAALLEESLPLHLRRQLGRTAQAALTEWLMERGTLDSGDPKRRSRSVRNVGFALLRYLDGFYAGGGGVLSNEQLAINQLYPDSLTAAASLTSDDDDFDGDDNSGSGGGNVGSPVSIGFDKFDVVDDVDAGIDGAAKSGSIVRRRIRRLRHRLRSTARRFLRAADGCLPNLTAASIGALPPLPPRRFSASRCLSKGLSDWTMTACQRQVLRRPLSPAPSLQWPSDILFESAAAGSIAQQKSRNAPAAATAAACRC